MVSPEDVKQIMGKFGTSGGFVERARLVQVICQITPTLSENLGLKTRSFSLPMNLISLWQYVFFTGQKNYPHAIVSSVEFDGQQ